MLTDNTYDPGDAAWQLICDRDCVAKWRNLHLQPGYSTLFSCGIWNTFAQSQTCITHPQLRKASPPVIMLKAYWFETLPLECRCLSEAKRVMSSFYICTKQGGLFFLYVRPHVSSPKLLLIYWASVMFAHAVHSMYYTNRECKSLPLNKYR
jgi:hypothetical protein